MKKVLKGISLTLAAVLLFACLGATAESGEPETAAFEAPAVPAPESVSTPAAVPATPATSAPAAAPVPESVSTPTAIPVTEPTSAPVAPAEEPTPAPADEPAEEPTSAPVDEPAEESTAAPVDEPEAEPSVAPSDEPAPEPTLAPTEPVVTAVSAPATLAEAMERGAPVYVQVSGGVSLYSSEKLTKKIGSFTSGATLLAVAAGENSRQERSLNVYFTTGGENGVEIRNGYVRVRDLRSESFTLAEENTGHPYLYQNRYAVWSASYQEAASETPAPVEAVEPAETEQPAESAEPAETEEPAETPAPEETEEPAETPAPEETEEPAETPAPEETEEPLETTGPAETEEPVEPESASLLVTIYVKEEKDSYVFGDALTMAVVVTPAEENAEGEPAETSASVVYQYQWQYATAEEPENWLDCPGETGPEMTIVLDESNYTHWWRVCVF